MRFAKLRALSTRHFVGGILLTASTARAQAAVTDSTAVLFRHGAAQLAAGDSAAAIVSFEAAATTRPSWRTLSMPHAIARRRMLADSAFALALEYEPDSVRWAVEYADFLFRSDAINVVRATALLSAAYRATEQRPADSLRSVIADRIGLLTWRRYEIVAHRRMTQANPETRIRDFVLFPKLDRQFRQMESQPLTPPLGAAQYEEARSYFARAVLAVPRNALAFRHLAMALVERGDWFALEGAAAQFQHRNPEHPWGALVRGLALHRLGKTAAAHRQFEEGMARLAPSGAATLFSLRRILLPKDTARLRAMESTARETLEATFWGIADPSRLIASNVVQTEFRARVVHAELRWSNEETHQNGVDSDRGVVFVRWGPPDHVASYKNEYSADVLEIWDYEQIDANFLFHRFRAGADSNAVAVVATIPSGAWHAPESNTGTSTGTATVAIAAFNRSWQLADSASQRVEFARRTVHRCPACNFA